MIKKLQRKFILITMGSLALVILLLLSSINIINIFQVNNRLDGVLTILSENQGRFPKFEPKRDPRHDPRFGYQMNEETQFETRYFTVEVKENGTIIKIDTSHIAAVSFEDAEEYTEEVLEKSKNKGFIDIYKYVIVDQPNGYLLIFLNCRSQFQTATLFLLTSSILALLILFLVFILVTIFSKKAIKPIIENIDKQKQFITDAGHEIKTPLAIISANADVLELTTGENEWITSIRNQTTRLNILVKNLLILSKMDEANIKLIFAEFNLSEVVLKTTSSFESIAESQNKKLEMNICKGLKLNGDESSIQQLVSILVDNAMKYSNENGTIKVSLSETKKGANLKVYNTVDIIDKNDLNKFFDRFYRSDSSRSRETGGYGIGLSIAKSIVEAHHGKITVTGEDKSICFKVLI